MGDIRFKNHEVAHNFCDICLHPTLTDVLLWIVDTKGEAVITSAMRYTTIHKNDSGIHLTEPLRAVDLRASTYNDPQKLVDTINKIWQYDRQRKRFKVANLKDTGLGLHLHIQVHDRTKPTT